MISMQVSQTEQASIQAAFRLVSALSGMYAPLYFTNHYFNVRLPTPYTPCALQRYSAQRAAVAAVAAVAA
jgi:hypothetical protein